MQLDHTRAPLYEAMKEYQLDRVVKFDVPGHKGGRGNKALRDFLGEACMRNDVNSMKPLDNLCHPVSVIKEAQQYAAGRLRSGKLHLHRQRSHRSSSGDGDVGMQGGG